MAGPDRMGNLYADEGADPRIHSAPKSRHLANVLPGESTLACSDPLIEPSARKPSTRAHCTLEVVPRSEFRTTSRHHQHQRIGGSIKAQSFPACIKPKDLLGEEHPITGGIVGYFMPTEAWSNAYNSSTNGPTLDAGHAVGVLILATMVNNEEPEPLELGAVRRLPRSVNLGCFALFRSFDDKDVPGTLRGWTCLAVPKTPYGQVLNQVLQNEVGRKQLTKATHFLAFPCSSEIELAAVHKGLCKKYNPLFNAWPPTS